MTVGQRLREERLRLGMSQPAFAALAEASKGALVKWEKDAAYPNALALIAFANAGADVLYILTGRRTADDPESITSKINEQIAEIRREMLDPARYRLPDEDDHQAEERLLEGNTNSLKALLRYDRPIMTEDQTLEVEHLLDIIENPAGLSLFRAADRVQLRKKRDDIRRGLREWLEGAPYQPDEVVTYMLTTLAMEYGAPVRLLSEMVYEMHRDITQKEKPPT